jgi:hypothetical protein
MGNKKQRISPTNIIGRKRRKEIIKSKNKLEGKE